jgi:hypothetical protein
MKTNFSPNYNTAKLRVCVDDIDGSIISGRVFSQRLKDVLVFSDMNGLVLRLDRLMDEQNYPQAFHRRRNFKTPANTTDGKPIQDDRPYMDEDSVNGAAGKRITFELQVLSRQNANWQGFVDFLDGAGGRRFESELGFFALVNDHLLN